MAAVEALCRDIIARRRIPSYRIVGHSDIAPDRKIRPRRVVRLAASGARRDRAVAAAVAGHRAGGAGAASGVVHRTAALADLARIGYCVSRGTEQVALAAFQRRFRPERWDGLLDGETSLGCATCGSRSRRRRPPRQTRLRTRFN